MKKKYISPEISIYKTELTNALMDVSGSVPSGEGELDNQGGGTGEDVENATAKKSFNLWDD